VSIKFVEKEERKQKGGYEYRTEHKTRTPRNVFFLVFGLLILCNYRVTMEVSSNDEEPIDQSTSEFDRCTAKTEDLQTRIIMPPLRAVVFHYFFFSVGCLSILMFLNPLAEVTP